ncbi:MAG TPA: NAD(P)/FAD-dependent oxidoreductase [Polyangium sp.]|nr:NAD(P)/FAD-dependent oxidoreductase [Polyangium sp.]
MDQHDRKFDAIVIGSGIGGLTAALTLARADRSVLVLEAGKAIGGYLNPFKRGVYEFNPGLHYLGECGPGQQFTRLLEMLGLSHDVEFHELSPNGFDRLILPGYEVSMPKGHDAYEARLLNDFPHERQGIAKFFRILGEFAQNVTLLVDASGERAPSRNIRRTPLFFKYGRMTFSQLLDGLIGDPLLKAVLSAQYGNYGLPPQQASALVGLATLQHYLTGAFFPIGGSRALRDAFVDHLERRGAELRPRHTVEKILIRAEKTHGVRCANGEEFFSDCIISNADAAKTYRDLIGMDKLPPRLREKVEHTRWSFSSICLFLGTEMDIGAAGMTDANVWNVADIDSGAAFEAIQRGCLPANDSYFLSSASLKNPQSTSAGVRQRHTLEFVTMAPYEPFAQWADKPTMKRGEEYATFKSTLADRYLKLVERHIPGIVEQLDVLEVGTPVTNANYTLAPFGAVYGPEHTPAPWGQPRYQIEGPLPGLFFCGSSTLGACIVFASISGFIAASMAMAMNRPE